MAQWFSENIFAVISLVLYLITQTLIVARSIWLTLQTSKKVEHIETMLQTHINSQTLHRTPDFEERLKQWDRVLDEIRADVKKLLDRGNGRGNS